MSAIRVRLRVRIAPLGPDGEKADRLRTAVATAALVERLSSAEPGAVVSVLANAPVATSESAMGECSAKAAELEGNLEAAGWEIFEAIGNLTDDRRAQAQEILAKCERRSSVMSTSCSLRRPCEGHRPRRCRC